MRLFFENSFDIRGDAGSRDRRLNAAGKLQEEVEGKRSLTRLQIQFKLHFSLLKT